MSVAFVFPYSEMEELLGLSDVSNVEQCFAKKFVYNWV